MKETTLALMDTGTEATVVRIAGGHGVAARMENMGIMPGATVSKVSGQRMGGPVTVRVGSSHVALGFGMASKVVVSPMKPDPR